MQSENEEKYNPIIYMRRQKFTVSNCLSLLIKLIKMKFFSEKLGSLDRIHFDVLDFCCKRIIKYYNIELVDFEVHI